MTEKKKKDNQNVRRRVVQSSDFNVPIVIT